MERKRIFLSSPTIHEEEQKYIQEAFDTNWIAPMGTNVNGFEVELATYVNTLHAAALNTGTAAIHLALILEGVGVGDIVFVSSLTFSATCNPIRYLGAIPVFIDSEEDTWNMSLKALQKAFVKYPQVKVVVLANLYGTPAKLDEISEICKEHGIPLIEDAAESLGATYRGRQTGTLGDIGIYSFNGNKIITTSGGGMLVSGDEKKVDRARFLSTQAREPARHYEHKEIGYNYRMSNVVAGIGRGQLQHLDEHIRLKKRIYETYKKSFSDIIEIAMNPYDEKCSRPNFWLSCIRLDENSMIKPLDIMMALDAENIESRPIWKPLHLQPVFADYDYIDNGGVGEKIFESGVCLPSDIKMTDQDLDRVVNGIRALWM